MRSFVTIAWLQLRLAFQSPGRLVLMFVLPLVFVGVLALATGGAGPKPVTLAVVDADGSFAAGRLVQALQAEGGLRVRLAPAEQLDRILAGHGAAAGLVIPSGYAQALAGGATPELQLVTVPGSSPQQTVRPAVARAADAAAATYRAALRLAGGDPGAVPAAYATAAAGRTQILVAQADAAGGGARNLALAQWAIGFTVMFVVMMVLMQSGAVQADRESGTWGRIGTTGAARPAVVAGYLAGTVIMGLVQFAGLLLLSRLLFQLNWGAPLPLAAMVLATVFAAAGLGLFLAGLVRTAEQQRLVAMLVAIVSAMLGGVYAPLDQLSPAMQHVGHLTLQAWAMDGLRSVVFRGAPWGGLVAPIGVLTAAALALTAGGLWRLRRI